MDDKFILFGLGDENSKDIAEIMKSKTAKKIIDFLADRKETSEKEISDGLGIPLNTTEYNLNKLVKTGLVKKSDKVFWSEKGKRIDQYRMANKHIIISPEKKPSLSYLKSILPFFAIIAIALVVIIGLSMNKGGVGNNESSGIIGGMEKSEELKGLKSFSSYEELKEFLKKNNDESNYGLYAGSEGFAMRTEQAAAPSMAKTGSDDGNSRSSDYSTTNNQVEGVDEADIVKNDGKYIYVVSGNYGTNKVVIVDAYPADEMKIVKEIDLNRTISQIFLNDDKLIIFSQGYEEVEIDGDVMPVEGDSGIGSTERKMAASDSAIGIWPGPRNYGRQKTYIDVFDVRDKNDIELENSYSVSGNYRDARMIGTYVYLISNEYANYNYPMPMYEINGVRSEMPIKSIYYFDYAGEYTFTTVSALDLEKGDFESKVYLMDSGGSVYVSEDNIYLTYQKYIDYNTRMDMMINDGILPILPENEREKADKVLESDKEIYDKYNSIYQIAVDYSESLKGKERSEFDEKLRDSIQEVESEISITYMKTVINKINIDEDNIEYEGKGEVNGNVLNQFSMDENERYFRIATTSGEQWQGTSKNNLYVLDKDLEIVGKLEGLAKGETIYSVRFIGERAYMVTFKSVDPFFVIDLSEPAEPKVLGYLKIPGFSNYLHPYDENHIIGIGKDVNESIDADKVHSEEAIYYTAVRGVKISLFDVSDFEHPKETAKFVIGDRGTDSSALYDHKAFLFNKEKNLIVLPISLYELDQSKFGSGKMPEYVYPELVWQGAYVLNINEDEISLRGRATHQKVDPKNYTGWGYDVQRSLYMGDVLYTISQVKIKANDLDSVKDINEVKLPFTENLRYY